MAENLNIADLITSLQFGTTITSADIVISLVITFITSLFIFYIYKKTYSGVLYSREFNVTLIIVSLVVSVIMIGISRNLALSLGLIGALSIVRFRNAVKDPKDVTFIFWSISVGIVNGVQFYKLSITSSIFIGIVLLLLSRNVTFKEPYVMVLKYTALDYKTLDSILQKYCQKYKLRSTTLQDNLNEKTIEVMVKKAKEDSLLKEVKNLQGMKQVMMFTYTGKLSE